MNFQIAIGSSLPPVMSFFCLSMYSSAILDTAMVQAAYLVVQAAYLVVQGSPRELNDSDDQGPESNRSKVVAHLR